MACLMLSPIAILAVTAAAVSDVNDLVPSSDAVVRLLAAALLGALVGIEREASDQPAGLRTHLTVALGAAVFGVVSTLGFSEFEADTADTNVRIDVTRVASQVVVGMGFLGAGIIFRSGTHIRNLTTAASLWVTAAIGLAAGVGDIGIAIVGAASVLVALFLLRVPRNLIRRKMTRMEMPVAVTLAEGADAGSVLSQVEALDGLDVEDVRWSKNDNRVVLDLVLRGVPGTRPDQLLGPVVARPDVIEVTTDGAVRASDD